MKWRELGSVTPSTSMSASSSRSPATPSTAPRWSFTLSRAHSVWPLQGGRHQVQDNLQNLLHHQDGDPVHPDLRYELQHGAGDGVQAGPHQQGGEALTNYCRIAKPFPMLSAGLSILTSMGNILPRYGQTFQWHLLSLRCPFRKSAQMCQPRSALQSQWKLRPRSV